MGIFTKLLRMLLLWVQGPLSEQRGLIQHYRENTDRPRGKLKQGQAK